MIQFQKQPNLLSRIFSCSALPWIFIALFIGAKIGGVLGLLLAIPIASVTKQIIDDLREEKSKKIEPKIPIND
jgi:predicted PurR-regulated permease PerM